MSLDTKIWLGEALSPTALCRALFLLFPALPCWSALECWLASIRWLLQPWVYLGGPLVAGWVLLLAAWFVGLCPWFTMVCKGADAVLVCRPMFAGWVARCYWVMQRIYLSARALYPLHTDES
jgi:hypothetical protein